ncbi:MAG: hypothetical protein KAS32_28170 [Candidatus Peribacteraceae bacterium]|nr:hypothetical protein [Candidatus Peribacteraceae bacterium]
MITIKEVVKLMTKKQKIFAVVILVILTAIAINIVFDSTPSDSAIYKAVITEKQYKDNGRFKYTIKPDTNDVRHDSFRIGTSADLQLETKIYIILSPIDYSIKNIQPEHTVSISECKPTKLVAETFGYVLSCDHDGFDPLKSQFEIDNIPVWAKSYNVLFVTKEGYKTWKRQF